MKSWIQALTRTRDAILGRVARLVGQAPRDERTIEEWEQALIAADVPARLAMEWLEEIASKKGGSLQERIAAAFRDAFGPDRAFDWSLPPRPPVVLLVGVNGSGKTTTSAKLAALAKQQGLRPLLAATDTFRAAGTDQLRIWADRVGCDVGAGAQGADAAAVAYDAMQAAVSRKSDVVFIDTAGRMHTKQHLMQELEKVKRSVAKSLPGAPHEVWFVADATIGNNALLQARTFHEAVGLTGLVVVKLDGTSKAGCVLAIRREIQAPVLFVGLGEGMDDLAPFRATEFVDALMGIERN